MKLASFRYCPVSIAAIMFGAGLVAYGDLTRNCHMMIGGFLLIMLAATALLARCSARSAQALEAARQAGYDEGYDDGRSVRPAVTYLARVSSSSDLVTGNSASQQL